ncbi:MAG: hypothetical protein Q8Q73_00240 [Stagnimonas sp.]|nr:hypothetical protein [Stagnimonas sp.]
MSRSIAALLLLLPLFAAAEVPQPPFRIEAQPHELGFVLRDARGQPVELPKLVLESESEPPLPQAAVGDAALTPDRRTAGWLVYYDFCCTSYPIPRELVLYRDGKIIWRFGADGLPIFAWRFADQGASVEIHRDTLHGNFSPQYERLHVASGRVLKHFDGNASPTAPAWVRKFEAAR